MTFVPANRAARVEVRALYQAQKVENTLWFACSQDITQSLLDELTAAVGAWWVAEVLPSLSTSVIYSETYGVDMTTQTGVTSTDITGFGTAGTASAEPMPGNVAITVTFRTANRGRSGRGRNYIYGLTPDSVSGNSVVAAFLDGIVTAYNLLLTTALPEEWTWVIASLFTNGAPRAQALLSLVTAAVVTDYDIDSQRRRLLHRGS